METTDYISTSDVILSSEQKKVVYDNYGLVISYLQSHRIPLRKVMAQHV